MPRVPARPGSRLEALDAWEAMPVSTDFDRRLYRRIEEEKARATWWSRLVRPFRPMFEAPLMSRSVPLAAAACLLVLAGVILERPTTWPFPRTRGADRIHPTRSGGAYARRYGDAAAVPPESGQRVRQRELDVICDLAASKTLLMLALAAGCADPGCLRPEENLCPREA